MVRTATLLIEQALRWRASFDDVVHTGNFAKIALTSPTARECPGNVLADLLRSWFGADAGQPGTMQYVELVPGEPHWHMRSASPVDSRNESELDTALGEAGNDVGTSA